MTWNVKALLMDIKSNLEKETNFTSVLRWYVPQIPSQLYCFISAKVNLQGNYLDWLGLVVIRNIK